MKIAVVGGGIAGHMAAAHTSRFIPHSKLVHIYDSAVPPIGVGEGTLPAFRRWLDRMTALSFAELQEQGAITWKKGIRFEGWGRANVEFNHFFGGDTVAYHISAEKLCPLLARFIQAERWDRHVIGLDSNGRIVSIQFEEGEAAVFDFVFDARGFPKDLTAEQLPLPAIPTNAALIRRGPIADFQGATRTVARPQGWIFVIPLATDTAYGYIYNSELTEGGGAEAEAEADFDQFMEGEGVSASSQSRALGFPNFRQRDFFDGALFTIGNAASFLEPLEATAIGLILHQLQAATYWLRDELVGVSGERRWQTAVLQQINDDIAATIDAVSLFVGWHYANGSIYDSPFWQFAQQNFNEQLEQAQETPTGQRFERLRQVGAAFPADKLALIPDSDAFASQIAPNRQVTQGFAGFDEFSFAQVGYGIGHFAKQGKGEANGQRQPPDPTPLLSGATLRQARHLLEQALLDGIDPLPGLADMLPPDYLDLTLFVQMGVAIKGGTTETAAFSPAHLITLAQKAAVSGQVPFSSPVNLRQILEQLADDLRQQAAWTADSPLWWEPLPGQSGPETIWNRLDGGRWLTLPEDGVTADALAESPDAPLWLAMPQLVASELTRSIHEALESAYQLGQLPLEKGSVGEVEDDHDHHDDHEDAPRTDWVRFITGLEADLIESAPELAGLAQYLLRHLGNYLKAATGRALIAPQRAMLSRYPAGTAGYAPHMDNPGGEKDNGRVLTMVLYLNSPEMAPTGGEIALWHRDGRLSDPPAVVLPPHSGLAVLFDSRRVAHQVRPLGDGPARWALSLWFNDQTQLQPLELPRPAITIGDVLRPIVEPPLPKETILFHQLDDADPAGKIIIHQKADSATVRVGLVCTVYKGGKALDAWCAHHFALGFEHIVLIFDSLGERSETADAQRLRAIYPESRLTIWDGAEMAERWETLSGDHGVDSLRQMVSNGRSSQAVSVRQTLNASAALQAAKTDVLGGQLLDWLLHLDVDELFYLHGAGRGGASLSDHFRTAENAGFQLVHYVNHELLQPALPNRPPLFKVNPRLAASRLGSTGWGQLEKYLQTNASQFRPWFHGYRNGKSAVLVREAQAAAGMHSWYLTDPTKEAQRLLAGPVVLHFRYRSVEGFGRKYRQISAAPRSAANYLFSPSVVEAHIVKEMNKLLEDEPSEADVTKHLEELYHSITHYSEEEVALLKTGRFDI